MKSFLILFAVICTPLWSENGRIIEGGQATAGQFPYVVSITENDRHICGGFIYSKQWIVTAASCVEGKTANKLKVVAGQVSVVSPDPNEQIHTVYVIFSYPEYNSTTKLNDVALLKLTTEIQFDSINVDFIPYGEELTNDKVGVFMGWGATFEGGYESINLRYGYSAIIPSTVDPTCGDYGAEFDVRSMFCCSITLIALPAGSPCQYDEGSPFVQEFVDPANSSLVIPTAVGIFSKVPKCDPTAKSVYTRLSVYYFWFLNTAGQQPTRQ
ncbi:hypothetical protein GHT06_013829 [Daphnia sinensis]|uniref:Peptidase S1 domain-containing protein n=1 Tax=Daphnia sinensis TaxID=1820382 RepID=A0AAD5KVF0_9CRUS|nr:hypothetical protein GHT06_013829 [Daphnia sinensis]